MTGQAGIFDVSLRLDAATPLYPGDAPPLVKRISSIAEGAALTASEISLGCHIGTHVDAPAHFLETGACLDQLNMAHFHGPATVVEFPPLDRLTPADVPAIQMPHRSHILLKTRNSALLTQSAFQPDFCYVTPAAVEALLDLDPLSIGFDYYSLDPPGETNFPSHRAVARRGLPCFVCLNLKEVPAGQYEFAAFPLKMPGLEALPVRAVLLAR